MIAKAPSARRVARLQQFAYSALIPTACSADNQTRIWNSLFQGSLSIQRVRLSFHDSHDDVITIVALDLRAHGWVVTGIQEDSAKTVEHALDSICDVEVLGEQLSDPSLYPEMPPMA